MEQGRSFPLPALSVAGAKQGLPYSVGVCRPVGVYGGASLAAFVELFPTRTRYSGLALSYNLAVAICGGTTPLVATWLVNVTGSTLAPAFYNDAISGPTLGKTRSTPE